MMKLYVIKKDNGQLWDYDECCWSNDVEGNYTSDKEIADAMAQYHGGYAVEMVEKPEHYDVLRSLMHEAFQLGDKVEKLNQALCAEQDSHEISDVQRKLMHRQLDEMTSYWDTLDRRIADLQGQLGEKVEDDED